jgi:hypothetical protein
VTELGRAAHICHLPTVVAAAAAAAAAVLAVMQEERAGKLQL